MDEHKIRHSVGKESDYLSDLELDEICNIIDYSNIYNDYEYADNFIFTTSLIERDETITGMCCGIIIKDIMLSNGKPIYYAFDYGH